MQVVRLMRAAGSAAAAAAVLRAAWGGSGELATLHWGGSGEVATLHWPPALLAELAAVAVDTCSCPAEGVVAAWDLLARAASDPHLREGALVEASPARVAAPPGGDAWVAPGTTPGCDDRDEAGGGSSPLGRLLRHLADDAARVALPVRIVSIMNIAYRFRTGLDTDM
eukprot:397438-Prorocentrum_minimum.AAC.4